MATATARPRRRVGIADDNPENRSQKTSLVEMAGFDAVPFEERYPRVEDLFEAMRQADVSALLCDHKLNEGDYAGFEGAEAVARLYESTIPGILVTDYVDSGEIRHSIRRHRRHVPVLIKGSEMRPKTIRSGIELWEKEVIDKQIPVSRQSRRVFVVVDDITSGSHPPMLTVFVPRWREHEAVTLPADLIPPAVLEQLKKGSVLVASVNAEAERIEDLYFDEVELVPDEDLRDE